MLRERAREELTGPKRRLREMSCEDILVLRRSIERRRQIPESVFERRSREEVLRQA